MSYILDALKKSDSERQASAVSGIAPGATYMVAPGRHGGNYGMLILAGAGMLVTGLALGAWRPWQALPPSASSHTAALPSAEAPAVPKAAVQPPAAAQAKPSPKPGPTMPAETKVATRTPPPKPVVASAPEAAAKPRLPAKTAPRAQAVSQAQPTATVEARPADQVVAFRDLPAEVRSGVPKISFGGFAGVDDADVRIAFINNRLLKEGEEVSPGVKLEQVGRDGVVLGYKGHHFRPAP